MAKRIEEMRLIDADEIKLPKGFFEKVDNVPKFYEWLGNLPTVDAVEVVRCKDCYYCATEKTFGKEHLYCDAFYEHAEGDLIGASLMVEPNHFCAWGERREDGKTN